MPGVGASTHMAQEYAEWDGDADVVRLLAVFGLSQYSSSMRSVLARWIHELAEVCGRQELPSEEELLVTIPSPKIPDVKRLGELSIDMLRFIAEEQDRHHEVCNADVARQFDMKPQAVMYHINRLLNAGVIEMEDAYTPKGKIDKRRKAIRIKREGRFVLRWI